MDPDDIEYGVSGEKGELADDSSVKKQSRAAADSDSGDLDSGDSDSDQEGNEIEEDRSNNEILGEISNESDEEELDEDSQEWSIKDFHVLTRCTLMQKINEERLILDPGAGFYLIDGDSLLLEVIGTKSWKYGQQLHLFYLIEIYLHQLCENGGGTFEIVFFEDMEKIWYKDILLRLFRKAAIHHLSVNCEFKVHCNWSDPFCPKFLDYLKIESPSFIFVNDGTNQIPPIVTALRILSYQCLAHQIDVALTSNVKKQTSKLHAIFIKSFFGHTKKGNKDFLLKAWNRLLVFLNTKFQAVTDFEYHGEGNILKDALFIRSINYYWDTLDENEKISERTKNTLNRWCYYFAVLGSQNLSKRISLARNIETQYISETNTPELYKFVHCVLSCLGDVCSNLSSYIDPECITDIIDLCVYHDVFESDHLSAILSSDEINSRFISLFELANSEGIVFESAKLEFSSIEEMMNGDSSEKESSLIAIESRLAAEFVGELKGKLNVSEVSALDLNSDNDDDFDDVYDWRSGDPLKDDIEQKTSNALSKIPHIRKRELKSIQLFNKYLTIYGQTLEKSMEPTLITKTENNKKENKRAEKNQQQQKQKSKKQNTKKNMKETIIEENKKKILEENKKKVAIQWKTKKGEIEADNDVALGIKKVSEFIRKSDCLKLGYEDPLVFLLQLQYDRWKQSFNDVNSGVISYVADLVQSLHRVLQMENTSENLKIKVIKYYLRLGFNGVAAQITKTLTDSKQTTLKVSDKCPVDLPYNIFQMKYMGHLLKRQERSDPDPRVTGFSPDTWQRELLDVVDKNESAVIVAPTSSGKTFCSFYCMEKVLRESDTNVVVYVSPTKALVNQVQASIYARYKKNMPAGMNVVGVFTRDYEHNSMTSQILVTVPQCLEILLLSPPRQQWVSRISYVIFDEVHCIGGETGGEVWEHLITLIRCPFLALSATVGNPEYFHSWLRCVNKFKELQNEQSGRPNMKYSVKLVVYKERYSDIKKNIYLPHKDEIVETHPCLYLDSCFISKSGFPSPLSLSPKEAYELWEAANFAFKNDADKTDILQNWNPETHFGDNLFITKQMARDYESSLKDQIGQMLKNDLPRTELFLHYLRNPLSSYCSVEDNNSFNIPGISEMEFDIYKTFPSLIEKLKSEEKLPVIVFMNNRQGIERLSRILVAHVDKKINNVKSKMSSVYAKQNEAGDRMKKPGGKVKKNRDSDGEEMEDHMQTYLQGFKSKQTLLIQKNEDACKFISPGALSIEDRERIFMSLKSNYHKKMLEFGIGFHHSGCYKKLRDAIEISFRSEFAQVVLATATLALGIHMPCKSVVFVGDDHYVDALNYRQMSGRSGRRGFDNLGNVIFYGVPMPKIRKLIKADISRLEGQFPVNCTIVMRLLLLVANADDCDDAHKKAMTVLSHPFIAHQAPLLQNQLRYYFLFVTDFLIRQALIDEKGVPLGFSGLASHLHYHEPGNIVFVSLLRKGIFHSLCKPSKVSQPISAGFTCEKCSISPIPGSRYTCTLCPFNKTLCSKCFTAHTFHRFRKEEHRKPDFEEIEPNLKYIYPEETLRSMVNILAHTFCTKEVPSIRLKKKSDNSFLLKRKPVTSKILLEPLNKDVEEAIRLYNDNVQSIFGNYLSVVSQAIPQNSSAILPISKKSWKLDSDLSESYTSSVDHFVQLSGCTNVDVRSSCLDTEEIRRMLPRQIYMDFNFIPSLSTGQTKNAYALDFFKHCSQDAIHRENWLQLSEVYDSLNDFRLLISTISIALEQLGPKDSDDHVVWAFKHLKYEYSHRFGTAYSLANIKY